MKTLLKAAGIGAALLGLVLVVNTARFRSRQVAVAPVEGVAVDAAAAAERLAGAIRCRTVSVSEQGPVPAEALDALRRHLEASFPLTHRQLEREAVAEHSLLYTWKGSDPSLKPVLLMAHMDVVPVEPGTEARWTHPPFSGQVAGGFVWGRGALDDKGALLGTLEGVEALLARGFAPERTVLLAFGHDEEVLGSGARAIAARLRARGVGLEAVLDEGSGLMDGFVPGLAAPVGLIGLAEKGYLSIELTATARGGHSSMPSKPSAIGRLARAITRLEARPVPGGIDGPVRLLLDRLGPELPLLQRIALANLWLFGGVLEHAMARSPAVDALQRTTTAVTMVRGGVKENVLPAQATAVVNFRVRPGDLTEGLLAHVREVVDDPGLSITVLSESPPSPVSPAEGSGYSGLEAAVREVFEGAPVAPTLVIGATDSRHFVSLARGVYRFAPLRVRTEDLARIHGTDERVGVEDHARGIRFFARLIERWTGSHVGALHDPDFPNLGELH